MKEFNLNNGTCWIALSYCFDECKDMGLETNSQSWFDYIAKRKYEIWQGLEDGTYKYESVKNKG